MDYYEAVSFLRAVCRPLDEQGHFGRYYRALDLLADGLDVYIRLRDVEGEGESR